MNTCINRNCNCNSRNKFPNLTHTSSCCNRYYCNLDCYFNSFHKCTKCGIKKHVCEFKQIDSVSYMGICINCHDMDCRFNQKCYSCDCKYGFMKSIDCNNCSSHYCSQNCYNRDFSICPKCGKRFHKCQFLKTGNCKYCK